MRGDRPALFLIRFLGLGFTPHARGSTLLDAFKSECSSVYPACAGIDPPSPATFKRRFGLPRMRGDRPV